MSKHTPTPYRVCPQPDGSWLVLAGGGTVRTGNVIGHKRSIVVAQCRSEATARLFAAAPELLVAIKDLMGVQDCAKDCWCNELASHETKKCEACEARAAIAKAEGRS